MLNQLIKTHTDPLRIPNPLLVISIFSMAFILIFFQITLFQTLNIFTDHLEATGIIAIALIGIMIGALIASKYLKQNPLLLCLIASHSLPISIIIGFAASIQPTSFFSQISLLLPFICISIIITTALTIRDAHFFYCFDLIGAACGALAVHFFLTAFREEGSMLYLALFSSCLSLIFTAYLEKSRLKCHLVILSTMMIVLFIATAYLQQKHDLFNIVRTKLEKRYPHLTMIASTSNFVGRYDVIRRSPKHKSLSSYNNGRVIDTIRNRPVSAYAIDPRLPFNFYDNPRIAILGLSGDGISKTAKYNSSEVYGVEINPAIVSLQRHELKQYNHNSYEGIKVSTLDGRSYIENSQTQFDMITLMNAHAARGYTVGRAASPEYLHTYEAMLAYIKHLSDNGMVNIEEPIASPEREVSVWKLIVTMKKALKDSGYQNPHEHFFIFQWKTPRYNYMQILMKKSPFNIEEIKRLKTWLKAVDNRIDMEKEAGRTLGPIKTKTTIVYHPFEGFNTNYQHILKGTATEGFLENHHLTVTTDDQPFHFDSDPKHRTVQKAYHRLLWPLIIFASILFLFLYKQYLAQIKENSLGFLLLLLSSALTGLAYLLIEVVSIQWFAIFLGTPVIAFSTVIGTLLISSGIGSICSKTFNNKQIILSLIIAMMILTVLLFTSADLFILFMGANLTTKILLTILFLAPLGFLMGVPLPFCLRQCQQAFGSNFTAILFSMNGAFSALAVPFALYLATTFGYAMTYTSGIGIYLACIILLNAYQSKQSQLKIIMIISFVLATFLLLPDVANSLMATKSHHKDLYEVYNLNYGKSKIRERNFVENGSSKKTRIAWHYWLIKGNSRIVLVDTGFSDKKLEKKWRLYFHTEPSKLLKDLQVKPDAVSDIILSHAHWDHVGSLDLYPNANIWLQKKEFEHLKQIVSEKNPYSQGYFWSTLNYLEKAFRKGTLHLVDGSHAFDSNLSIHYEGSHTPGSQYIKVSTNDGTVIIAGDSTPLYKNNFWHKATPSSVSSEKNLESIQKYHRIAGSTYLIIPGHDRRSLTKFPRVTKRISKVTMAQKHW